MLWGGGPIPAGGEGGTLQAGVHCGDPRLVSAARLPPRLWVGPQLLSPSLSTLPPPAPRDPSSAFLPLVSFMRPLGWKPGTDGWTGAAVSLGSGDPGRQPAPATGSLETDPTKPSNRPGNLVQKEAQCQGPWLGSDDNHGDFRRSSAPRWTGP